MVEGKEFLFRVGLALLDSSQDTLVKMDMEEMMKVGRWVLTEGAWSLSSQRKVCMCAIVMSLQWWICMCVVMCVCYHVFLSPEEGDICVLLCVKYFQKGMRSLHESDPEQLIQKALKIKLHSKKIKK